VGRRIPSKQELLGHKMMTMTLRYEHLATDHRVAMVRLLNTPDRGTNRTM
jgi:hypothetical protein